MAFVLAVRRFLSVVLVLALTASVAWSQTSAANSAPAPGHIELEAKPPDEPYPSSSPDIGTLPDAAPSTGALPPAGGTDESNAPPAAETVAHPPEIETYVVPVYPSEARAKKVQGRVLLMVIVDASGKVEDNIQVVDSIPMLDHAAIDAVHQWSFTPARDANGNPVRVQLEVPVPFSLR